MSLNKKVGLMSLIWTQFYEGKLSVYLYRICINKEKKIEVTIIRRSSNHLKLVFLFFLNVFQIFKHRCQCLKLQLILLFNLNFMS